VLLATGGGFGGYIVRTYEVISADGHLEVPIDFAARVPQRFKDLAPRLIRKPDGTETWFMDGFERDNVGNLHCGMHYDQWTPATAQTYHNPDGSPRPGTGSPVQRLREQDHDGIDAEVLFYPVYGPAFMRNMRARNVDAYRAIIRAYNDFLAEYCSLAPDRLIGCALVPESGVEDAIAEVERIRRLGLIAISLTAWPNGTHAPKPDEDDRFWAAVLDLDARLAVHQTFGMGLNSPDRVALEAAVSASNKQPPWSYDIGRLILYGTFDRFTNLKIYFAETGAGWLAHTLCFADEYYLRWFKYFDLKLRKLPSQYWRDHCRFSFIIDRLAMPLARFTGLDLLMWGSDFPHSVGTYPDSREMLDDMFEEVSAQARRAVLVDNVCEFFGLDPDRSLTPTP